MSTTKEVRRPAVWHSTSFCSVRYLTSASTTACCASIDTSNIPTQTNVVVVVSFKRGGHESPYSNQSKFKWSNYTTDPSQDETTNTNGSGIEYTASHIWGLKQWAAKNVLEKNMLKWCLLVVQLQLHKVTIPCPLLQCGDVECIY